MKHAERFLFEWEGGNLAPYHIPFKYSENGGILVAKLLHAYKIGILSNNWNFPMEQIVYMNDGAKRLHEVAHTRFTI